MPGVVSFGSKSQQAYDELKRRILMLELAPGQLLNESEVVEQLGSSRTPVREAIQRLAAEKLVVARPRQTPFIAPILASDLAEIIEIRQILEVPAARLAAERGTAAERKQLEAACAAFRKKARAGDQKGILTTDGAIHELIASMSRNSFLSDYAERLALFSQRVWWLSVSDPRKDESFIACHDVLTRTICVGDTEAAAKAAEEHIAMFQTRLGRLVAPAGAVAGSATVRRRA